MTRFACCAIGSTMPDVELNLLDLEGSISAPAGCGKTQLSCDALKLHTNRKPVLVLTHTNAGVAALRGRLQRAGVQASRYRVSTIDGWAMRLIRIFPARSGHDPDILLLKSPNRNYPAIRQAALELLAARHLDDVIASTYDRLIVDEYQDCLTIQHRLVAELAEVLPTVVLGDPLQAIFNFGDNVLVNWTADVIKAFPEVGQLKIPHRWKNAGHEGLGLWLLEMRAELLAGRSVDLRHVHEDVAWIRLTGGERDHEQRLKAGMAKAPVANGKVLVIVRSKDRNGELRRQFASQLPGAVVAEAVDMSDLVSFGERFRLGQDPLGPLADFAETVMTNVSSADFLQRVASIRADRHRNPPNAAEAAAIAFVADPTYPSAGKVLEELSALGGVRVHRPAILQGCYALLRTCSGGSTPYDAAVSVRERSRLIGRPLARRTVGSTLLLKGLEAELSVVLHAEEMNAAHFYVAATRGSHGLVVCSSIPTIP